MDKEKFMQFVSKAYDMDAKIEISLYSHLKLSEESAKELAEEFAEIVGEKVEETASVDFKSRWFIVDSRAHDISVWHENSKDKKLLKEHLNQLLKDEEAEA